MGTINQVVGAVRSAAAAGAGNVPRPGVLSTAGAGGAAQVAHLSDSLAGGPVRIQALAWDQAGKAVVNGSALGRSDVVLGWSLHPAQVELAQAAERQGAAFVNSPGAILDSHRKVDMAQVLRRAGIDTVEPLGAFRTTSELRQIVERAGGPVRVTGGFGHSRLPATEAAARIEVPHLGVPQPRVLHTSEDVASFARTHLDNERTYVAQPVVDGQHAHVVVAGGEVLRTADDAPLAGGLTAPEQQKAVRAVEAFGLRAAGVDVVRTPDGRLLVQDVHATPLLPLEQLDRLGASREVSTAAHAGADGPAAAAGSIAAQVRSEKVQVGIINTGQRPGKNLARVMAEVERQGAQPHFVPLGALEVGPGGALAAHGQALPPIDVFLTRTGSVIDGAGVEKLRQLEDARHVVVNGSDAMSNVRDKNTQAQILQRAGVPHPVSLNVAGPQDADRAIELIGRSMVLKNPASSEGRGVMFLDGEDAVRGAIELFHRRGTHSRLVAEADGVSPGSSPARIPLHGRADAERAIHELGDAVLGSDARTGADLLQMRRAIRLVDETTGASVTVDRPLSVLTVTQAFDDARPGATLKAETWFREAAGVDTRVHIMRDDTGRYNVIAAMERRAAPSAFGEARSNLSLGGSAHPVDLSPEQERVAIAAAEASGLDLVGIDLLATSKGPVVIEWNSSPGLDIEKTVGPVADRWVDTLLKRGAAARDERLQRP